MSEFNHPFKFVKLRNKSSEDEININNKLSYESFCAFVANFYEEREQCWDFEYKREKKFNALSIDT